MKIPSPTSYIRDLTDKTKVGKKGEFKAYVIEGIENFNLKKVYMASVNSNSGGRSSTGVYWSEFSEAEAEAMIILDKLYNQLEEDKIIWEEERNNFKNKK